MSNDEEPANITRSEVNQLINALERLRTIERDLVEVLHDVTERRLRTNNEERRSTVSSESVEEATEQEETTVGSVSDLDTEQESQGKGEVLLPYSKIRKNDLIRIKNPRTGQQRKGYASGATESKLFIKVTTPNQSVVNRVPRNLKVITKAEYDRTNLW